MSPSDRIRRPPPERKEPLRGGWLSLFGPPPPPGSGEASGAAGSPGGNDVVSRAVDLGYRVVDEYMRQGQNAARRMARRDYGPQAVASDVQEMTARAVQYGAELMDIWVGLLGQAASSPADLGAAAAGGLGREGEEGDSLRPRGAAGNPGAAARAGGGTRVTLAIESTVPVQVQLDVEDAAGRELEVQDLQRTEGAAAPTLGGVTLGGEPPRLRLCVPADQPEGIYAGLVLDARSRTVAGTLVVTVGSPPSAGTSGGA